MEIKRTQEVYLKIFEELMQTIREDNNIASHLDSEDIKFLGETWERKLKESGVYNKRNSFGNGNGIFNPAAYQVPGAFPRSFPMQQPGLPHPDLYGRGNRPEQFGILPGNTPSGPRMGYFGTGGFPSTFLPSGKKGFEEDAQSTEFAGIENKEAVNEEENQLVSQSSFRDLGNDDIGLDEIEEKEAKKGPLKLTISMSKNFDKKKSIEKKTKKQLEEVKEDDDDDLFDDSESKNGSNKGAEDNKNKNLDIKFTSTAKKTNGGDDEKSEKSDAELGKREQESDDEDLFVKKK